VFYVVILTLNAVKGKDPDDLHPTRTARPFLTKLQPLLLPLLCSYSANGALYISLGRTGSPASLLAGAGSPRFEAHPIPKG
jgi:hypothetical protein